MRRRGLVYPIYQLVVRVLQLLYYDNIETYSAEVLGILLESEIQNNLLISLITENKASYATDWLLATVIDDSGEIILTSFWSKPFNILLYETKNTRNDDAVELLAREFRKAGYSLPGVMAERGLAQRFAKAYTPPKMSESHMSVVAMRLDRLAQYEKAPGFCRELSKSDMFFTPYWEHAFSEDCRVHVFTISEDTKRIESRLGRGIHFIWEDGVPVSQAVHGRNTPNGAIINWVYTPPHYRGRGYATSVVAELSESLLKRGKDFCCLLADADNPASRRLYSKLGYYDVCELEDIKFL